MRFGTRRRSVQHGGWKKGQCGPRRRVLLIDPTAPRRPGRVATTVVLLLRGRRAARAPAGGAAATVGILEQILQILVREQERFVTSAIVVLTSTLDDDPVFVLPDADVPETLAVEQEADRPQDVLIIGCREAREEFHRCLGGDARRAVAVASCSLAALISSLESSKVVNAFRMGRSRAGAIPQMTAPPGRSMIVGERRSGRRSSISAPIERNRPDQGPGRPG